MSEPVCVHCKKPIVGQYLTALGGHWHPDHFVCGGCSKPVQENSFPAHQNRPWHRRCYLDRVAPKCSLCGRPISGTYLKGHWGEQYCAEHASNAQCSFCDRITPAAKNLTADVDPPCSFCRTSAVATPDVARKLFHNAILWAGMRGLNIPEAQVPIELVTRPELARLMNSSTCKHLAITRATTVTTLFGQRVSTRVDGIAILRGLPAKLFQGTCAHELGHAWMRLHGIDRLASRDEEGFCEYLAHSWYHENLSPESRFYQNRIATNPDPVYGEGFRVFQALATKKGFLPVRDFLLKHKRMP
jgi:hypothetical protein